MSIFTDPTTGKFLGGIVLYEFEDYARTKLTMAVEIARGDIDFDNAIACEIKDNGDFIDIPVTINPRLVTHVAFVKGDGSVRLSEFASYDKELTKALQHLANRLMENAGVEVTDEEKEAFREREIGTHVTHCCAMHGCKYGRKHYCPVELKTHKQEYPCEYCVDVKEAEEQIAQLQTEINFVRSLKKG